ncbi:MAG TPA: hypothetical protein VEW94_00535, partial [Chloroflexia bacterium]|nr:hypothetical protein [Chloroflexia bacterium]
MLARRNLHPAKSRQISLALADLILLSASKLLPTWSQTTPPRSAPALDLLPLSFEPNGGQTDPSGSFLA